MIICRTPYRISFFGGGTDYPGWYRIHGGAVLAATIDKYCYLSCRHLPRFCEQRSRIISSSLQDSVLNGELVHPEIRQVLRHLRISQGVEIHHDSDLPDRSGIGSSSAFIVGLSHAACALRGRKPHPHELALKSIHIEQSLLNTTVGSQDQIMAAYGGLRHAKFHPSGEISVQSVEIPPERLCELNDHLMLFYTGISRTASDIARSYVNEIQIRHSQLQKMRDLVEEGLSILNSGKDLLRFGRLLHETWLLKRSLSSQVSNPQIDRFYTLAREGGALGGKLTGAGGGGFLLLFVPTRQQQAVRKKLHHLTHVPFRFESFGSQILDHDGGRADAPVREEPGLQPLEIIQKLVPVRSV